MLRAKLKSATLFYLKSVSGADYSEYLVFYVKISG